jgi:alpha-methylacyl-CoA racemase
MLHVMDLPLAGVRVLDLTRLLPGAYCTLVLASLGADVIKVEEPTRGDYFRELPPPTLFPLLNRGKRSVALDLKRPEGLEALRRLVATSRVLVESFRPGTLERLGAGPRDLREVNPDLIICSLSGYGAQGPYRDRPGHDVNYLSTAGYLGLQRRPGEDPVLPATPLADVMGGMQGALAVLAALLRRGPGADLQVSLLEATLPLMLLPLAEVAATGADPAPSGGLLTGGLPGYGVYRTADGRHLGVGALEEKFWETLCRALGRPDLIALRARDPVACQDELRAVFAGAPLAHWVAILPPEACVTPVLTVDEALANPQVRACGLLDLDPDPSPRSSAWGRAQLRPAPRLGEHTEEILREIGL